MSYCLDLKRMPNDRGAAWPWLISVLAHVLVLCWTVDQHNTNQGALSIESSAILRIEAKISTDRTFKSSLPEESGGSVDWGRHGDGQLHTEQLARDSISGRVSENWKAAGEVILTSAKPDSEVPAHLNDLSDSSRFYVRSEVSKPPVILFWPELDELGGGNDGMPKSYRLRLFISKNGDVLDVQTLLPRIDRGFVEMLITALKTARFAPAQLDGVAVNSQINIEIEPQDAVAGSSRVSDHKDVRPPHSS